MTIVLQTNVLITKPSRRMEHAVKHLVVNWRSSDKMESLVRNASHIPELKTMVRDVAKITALRVSFNGMEPV